ncbi:hypothetical protein BLNAU_9273 [Blattamonas nauphoetae]|uniref:Uncharacterized protein n=1 Tax=Blattamonas nauphoetae TaxID=2049346 RepID=A0ABQ9XW83_9EUKA|nr:hypothetical protein BLNAU_9273 [Blattamonas nauphoetae]
MDCSPFLNWNEDKLGSAEEKAEIFMSLVATLKIQPALDDSLEAKAVRLFESMCWGGQESADDFLNSFGPTTDLSSRDFVQCIVVLLSTASQVITTAAMEILCALVLFCSPIIRYSLVKADLIPHIIVTLNLMSITLAEAFGIHISVMKSI